MLSILGNKFVDQPLFMKNEDWYFFDFKSKKYKLTTKAPDDVKKSYVDFYSDLNRVME